MEPALLRVIDARGPQDPLEALQRHHQGQYLRWYLSDLGAKTALIEDNYFDRDYLSEFAAFYCTSSAGYRNCCQRVHYFATELSRDLLADAAGGAPDACERMQKSYLGFMVLRPFSLLVSAAAPPNPRSSEPMPDPTRDYFDLIPTAIVAAAHDDVRVHLQMNDVRDLGVPISAFH